MQELEDLLERILSLRQNIEQLEQEEQSLREQVAAWMKQHDRQLINANSSAGLLKVRRDERVKIAYDEDLIRQRLGQTAYEQLLSVDWQKAKQRIAELPSWLGAHYPELASLDRQKIKAAVESGALDARTFVGAFTREVKEIVSITRLQKS